jgi:hypothetical protein
MTLDTRNKESVSVCLRVLNEVGRGLLSGDRNERDALVGRLEPDDLRPFRGLLFVILGTITLTFTSFSFLFFLRGRR